MTTLKSESLLLIGKDSPLWTHLFFYSFLAALSFHLLACFLFKVNLFTLFESFPTSSKAIVSSGWIKGTPTSIDEQKKGEHPLLSLLKPPAEDPPLLHPRLTTPHLTPRTEEAQITHISLPHSLPIEHNTLYLSSELADRLSFFPTSFTLSKELNGIWAYDIGVDDATGKIVWIFGESIHPEIEKELFKLSFSEQTGQGVTKGRVVLTLSHFDGSHD